jgi:hypothetical protein
MNPVLYVDLKLFEPWHNKRVFEEYVIKRLNQTVGQFIIGITLYVSVWQSSRVYK